MSSIFLVAATLCTIIKTAFSMIELHLHANGLPNSGFTATEEIVYYGYPLETHDVVTKDGYILQLHRIPHGLNNSSEDVKPVALFFPGMLCSSGVYIINGPKKSLPLLLADLGYDVWIGNARGTTYSRRHVTLNPHINRAQFWNFSNHEVGIYDAPTFVDFILNFTGQYDLYYVGHSLGTTVYFIMVTELPEYNEKIRLSIMLAPITYLTHFFNPFGRLAGDFVDVLRVLFLDILHIYYILPESTVLNFLSQTLCAEKSPLKELCADVLFLLCGFDSPQLNLTMFPLIAGVAPAATSTKSVLQYGQNYKSAKFRQYDYGAIGNVRQYGQFSPPSYNTKLATAPVALYYGTNDWFSSVKDVEQLASELPNLVRSYVVPWDKFNHLDFIWAKDVYDLLYKDIIQLIQQY